MFNLIHVLTVRLHLGDSLNILIKSCFCDKTNTMICLEVLTPVKGTTL